MKEIADKHKDQIDAIRKKSGANGDSNPLVAGVHRATLLGLTSSFSLERRLGKLDEAEVEELTKLVNEVDLEIDSRFQV